MRKKLYSVIVLFIWIFAMGSLVGAHFLLKRKPYFYKNIKEKDEILNGLVGELKTGIERYENILIRLQDGKFHLLGSGFELEEKELLKKNSLLTREIIFHISDPIAVERKMMANEAITGLNNAEKVAFSMGYGAILHRDGKYYFVVCKNAYDDFVRQYGITRSLCQEREQNKERRKE